MIADECHDGIPGIGRIKFLKDDFMRRLKLLKEWNEGEECTEEFVEDPKISFRFIISSFFVDRVFSTCSAVMQQGVRRSTSGGRYTTFKYKKRSVWPLISSHNGTTLSVHGSPHPPLYNQPIAPPFGELQYLLHREHTLIPFAVCDDCRHLSRL
jgi:hypothetical protein